MMRNLTLKVAVAATSLVMLATAGSAQSIGQLESRTMHWRAPQSINLNSTYGLPTSTGFSAGLHTLGPTSTGTANFIDAIGASANVILRRGNDSAGTLTAPTNGQTLANIFVGGYDGTSAWPVNRAGITAFATENWSATAQGTAVEINTTPVTTTTIGSHNLRVNNDGSVSIGNTTALGAGGLRVNTKAQIAPINSALTNAATSFIVGLNTTLGNSAGNYAYPAEIQQNVTNTDRLQFAGYRRVAGSAWQGTAYRLQFATDSSFTDGSKAYVEIGAGSALTSGGGLVAIGTAGADAFTVDSDQSVNVLGVGKFKGSAGSTSAGAPALSVAPTVSTSFVNGIDLTLNEAATATASYKPIFNKWQVNDAATAASASDFIKAWQLNYDINTVGAANPGPGGRIALNVIAQLNHARGGGLNDFVGGYFHGWAFVSDGGGVGTERGSVFGGAAEGLLQGTATNFQAVHAWEMNVGMFSGTSAKYKTIVNYSNVGSTGAIDAVKGSVIDAMAWYYSQASALIGFDSVFLIGDPTPTLASGVKFPVSSTGSILVTGYAAAGSVHSQATNGFDLTRTDFSGNAWMSNNATITGAGAINGTILTGTTSLIAASASNGITITTGNITRNAAAGSLVIETGTNAGNIMVMKTAGSGRVTIADASITVQQTTASTSTTTGALIVSGGMGVAGAINAASGSFSVDTSGNVSGKRFIATNPYTVAGLPVGPIGSIARVTDATSPTIGNAVVGGGSANALVWYNNSTWTVIGK